MIVRPMLVLAGLALGGCMLANAAPSTRLRDAVAQMGSDLRWNRLDLAVERVSPTHRDAFVAARSAWGRSVTIADAEVVAVRFENGEAEAVSSYAISWLRLDSTRVRTTVVELRWARDGRDYFVTGERVQDGDPSLLPGLPVADPAAPDPAPTDPAPAGAAALDPNA